MDNGFYKPLLIGILSLTLLGGCRGVSEGSNKDLKKASGNVPALNYTLEKGANISVAEADNTTTIPAAPGDLLATALSHKNIDIVWQDNSDNEMAFNIERRSGTIGTFSHLTVVKAVTGSGANGFYKDSGLLPDTTYCYRMQAYNLNGNSPYSSESCATTKHKPVAMPTAVTGSAVNVTVNSVVLTGMVNPNGLIAGAFFQWGPPTSSFESTTPLKSLGSGMNDIDLSAELTGLSLDTTYYYRMVAVTMDGKTVFGSQNSFTTLKLPERLVNGSFSSGTKGWHLVGDFWSGTDFTKYHTPPGYAAGGVVNSTGQVKYNARGSMYQSVAIPSNATLAVLSLWLNVTSKESTITKQKDKLYVEILDSSGRFLEKLSGYSNLDRTSGIIYSKKSFDLTSYKDRTIRIQFRITTDSASYTIFRIDDVSLMSDG